MIPLRDNNPRTTTPVVTILVILVNCLVFLRELSFSSRELTQVMQAYALIPVRSAAFFTGHPVPASEGLLPFFTSMFLHGGWMHLIGNMWFLWIFGDNVEDRLGHFRFLLLYVLAGIAAAFAFVILIPNTTVPTVGASGAISGVMGAYLITFPRARILTLVPILFFLTTIEIPAVLILIYWFALQFLSGVASIATTTQTGGGPQATGGVAWFAHVGGFIAGIPLMLLLRGRAPRRTRAASWT